MSELTNDKLLQSIKEYFNEYFDEQDKKLEKIIDEQSVLINFFELKIKAIENSLDELAAHVIIYTDENKKLFKYVQDLARVNGWKLPEKMELNSTN